MNLVPLLTALALVASPALADTAAQTRSAAPDPRDAKLVQLTSALRQANAKLDQVRAQRDALASRYQDLVADEATAFAIAQQDAPAKTAAPNLPH